MRGWGAYSRETEVKKNREGEAGSGYRRSRPKERLLYVNWCTLHRLLYTLGGIHSVHLFYNRTVEKWKLENVRLVFACLYSSSAQNMHVTVGTATFTTNLLHKNRSS